MGILEYHSYQSDLAIAETLKSLLHKLIAFSKAHFEPCSKTARTGTSLELKNSDIPFILPRPKSFRYRLATSLTFRVPFSDVDMMGHVNNVCYLRYFENARTEHIHSMAGDWKKSNLGLILAHAEIDYKSPASYRDEIRVEIRVASVGNSSWVYEYSVLDHNEQVIATGKTVQVAYDYELKKSIPIPEEFRERLLKEKGARLT